MLFFNQTFAWHANIFRQRKKNIERQLWFKRKIQIWIIFYTNNVSLLLLRVCETKKITETRISLKRKVIVLKKISYFLLLTVRRMKKKHQNKLHSNSKAIRTWVPKRNVFFFSSDTQKISSKLYCGSRRRRKREKKKIVCAVGFFSSFFSPQNYART